MITPAEREFALKLLDDTRDAVLLMLDGLSSEQLLYCPEPGRWSVAENLEHVIVVEQRLVPALEKLLPEPPDLTTRPAWDDQEVLRRIGQSQNGYSRRSALCPSRAGRWKNYRGNSRPLVRTRATS